jgi:ATP sulfurylase
MSKFIIIDKSDYINAINLQLGLYQPLKGFVNLKEFKNILLNK